MISYYLNLASRTDRRSSFEDAWNPLLPFKVTRIEAVDKRSLPSAYVAEHQFRLRHLTASTTMPAAANLRGILACSLSHLQTLQTALADGITECGVLIFEDDARPLTGAEELPQRIALALAAAPHAELIDCSIPCDEVAAALPAFTAARGAQKWGVDTDTSPIEGASASLALVASSGAFCLWYSKQGAERMIRCLQGNEFLSIEGMKAVFAKQKRLLYLTPPVAYHPPRTLVGSDIIP
jgi:hypothetical protein